MNKIILEDKIIVYRDVFDNIEDIMSFLKETEEYKEKTGFIRPWGPWAGTWKGKSTEMENISFDYKDSDNEIDIRQKDIVNNIHSVFINITNDYLSMYKKDPEWPSQVNYWDNFEDYPWINDRHIDFLKYNKDQEIEQLSSPLAMNYHTDYNYFDKERMGGHKLVTVTIYVNDDYEGGEISVYSPKTNKLYNYKPKAGDIVVFPSGIDYYHGVLPFYGNDRYLIRMFKSYFYKGSERWIENQNKYGEEIWHQMEEERLREVWMNGENLRVLVPIGTDSYDTRLKTIYVEEDIFYLDGTKI